VVGFFGRRAIPPLWQSKTPRPDSAHLLGGIRACAYCRHAAKKAEDRRKMLAEKENHAFAGLQGKAFGHQSGIRGLRWHDFDNWEGGPNELALSRTCFAVHVIQEYGQKGSQLGGLAESVLLTNAHTGPFNRTPGQPSPRYVSMKERSETLRDLFPQGSSGNRLFSRMRESALEMLKREQLDDEQMTFE